MTHENLEPYRKRRRFIAAVVAISLGLLAGGALCEATLRILDLGYGSAPHLSHPILHHVHPSNYSFRVHDPAGEFGGHLMHYGSDGRRVRELPAAARVRVAPARVAFVGDSFVLGTQLGYDQTFVGLVQRKFPSIEMRNYGVSSYSPVLYALQWRETIKRFGPTHVFLLLYSNDVRGDADYAKNGVFDTHGELLAVARPPTPTWIVWSRKLYLIRLVRKVFLQQKFMWRQSGDAGVPVGGHLEEDPELSPLTQRYLKHFASKVDHAGAKLLISAVPSKARLAGKGTAQRPEFASRVEAFCQAEGLPYLDLIKPFQEASRGDQPLYYDRDIHWTAKGMEVVASELQDFVTSIE